MVRNILSPAFCTSSLMPVLKILKQSFIIPNVPSTSFLIHSYHCEKKMSGRLQDNLIGGTVVAQLRYPLSTINQASTSYNTRTTLPHRSLSLSSNCTSRSFRPPLSATAKLSNNTKLLLFYLAGWPFVVARICWQLITVIL